MNGICTKSVEFKTIIVDIIPNFTYTQTGKVRKLKRRREKQMKRTIALFLLLAMAMSLCACGGGTAAPVEAMQSAQAEPTEAPEPTPTPLTRVPFEEISVEGSGVAAVRIKDFSDSKGTSNPICLTLETESLSEYSADITVWACVDGVQVKVCDDLSTAWWKDSAYALPQEGENETKIYLDCRDLAACGIKEHTDIDLLFLFQDYYNGTSEYQEVHIYPYGESNAGKYEREAQAGDVVLVNNEYVSVTVTDSGYGVSRGWMSDPTDYAFRYFVQNKTDKLLMINYTNPDGSYVTMENDRYVFPDAGYYAVSNGFDPSAIAGEGEVIELAMDWTVKDGFGREELAVENVVFTDDDPSGFDTLPQFTPVTALETEALTVKITDLGLSGDGTYLKACLSAENKGEEELSAYVQATLDGLALPIQEEFFPVTFSNSDEVSIYGIMPNDTKSTEVYLSCADLQENGVTEFGELTFYLSAKNSNFDDIAEPTELKLTPFGENTATRFTREDVETDLVIADNEKCRVVLMDYGYGTASASKFDAGTYLMEFFVENKTDQEAIVYPSYTVINGVAMEDINNLGLAMASIQPVTLPAGASGFFYCRISPSDLHLMRYQIDDGMVSVSAEDMEKIQALVNAETVDTVEMKFYMRSAGFATYTDEVITLQ